MVEIRLSRALLAIVEVLGFIQNRKRKYRLFDQRMIELELLGSVKIDCRRGWVRGRENRSQEAGEGAAVAQVRGLLA